MNDPMWQNYFLRSDDGFTGFWGDYLATGEHKMLFIVGCGFDPRTCACVEAILGCGGTGSRDCVGLQLVEGPNSPSKKYVDLAAKNVKKLQGLFKSRGRFSEEQIRLLSDDGRRVGSRAAAMLFSDPANFANYTDVVVDISGLPRAIYFPLVTTLIHTLGAHERHPNLHVVVSDDAVLDAKIRDEGVDEFASYLHGFGAAQMDLEATALQPRVWIPLLGPGQQVQLERINTLVVPSEVCPVLPFPSRDPRRADNLVMEYREFLFDQLRTEPRNLLYVSEQNPFEAYRQLRQVALHYTTVLKPLDGCKIVISASCSKLLSVGAILTAHELYAAGTTVGVAHVETQGYLAKGSMTPSNENSLHTMWLVGDCYAT